MYSHAIARAASISLLFWIDRWLPIAHLELKPDSCLSTVFFDRRPLTAVSVYSKSARLKKGAQGHSALIPLKTLLVVFPGTVLGDSELRGMMTIVESRE